MSFHKIILQFEPTYFSREFVGSLCCVLPCVSLHKLPLHQVPGDSGLHRRHRPLRNQRLLRLPPVLGCPQTAVRGGQGGGSDPQYNW